MPPTVPTTVPPDTTHQPATEVPATGPVAPSAGAAAAAVSHTVGAFSIETFCNQGALSLTHDDAQGFLQWLGGFGVAPNFWLTDAGVKAWAYYEDFDNWQDTYGVDSALISYHSGHGGMDNNGVFYVPMGSAWAGNDCTVVSSNMAIGNEYCRYAFWSTCFSLRVFDGHSPYRTWSGPNKGLRMLFGFETVSYDNANYGRNFGNRWNAGDSLSSAWLNASWAISPHQTPTAAACGASAAEAQARCYNERSFEWGAVSSNYWWWRWYAAAASARELNRAVPDQPLTAAFAPPSAQSAGRLAAQFGFDASSLSSGAAGATVSDGRRLLTVGPDGAVVAQLAQANLENHAVLDAQTAQSVAADALAQYGLDGVGPMVLDRVASVNGAGTSARDPERIDGPYTTETLVQYRQTIAGIPVVSSDAGVIQVLVDNDGVVTSVTSSARVVDDLSERSLRGPASEPVPPGQTATDGGAPDVDRLLARAFSDRLRGMALKGDLPVGFATVPGTTEVGYDVQGDRASLVAVRTVEVDFGGYRKRYLVKAPIA
ncbi:DUF6345 domain-containing protein [Nocardioides sp.]|uniref:DUF6345 domain-containing protein n=1 Tax=Nocardioides sp. TaxID=35761 RepID=UPI0027266941|nr:DUF6345 domain-containing protein [Nocardioides sp.]MDO9454525.1 DUF6345 domain-containing protein [Nocardioides sp.]